MYFAAWQCLQSPLSLGRQSDTHNPGIRQGEMYVRLHWEVVMNMNGTLFLMYCGLVITENMMINKGSLSSVCRLSAALMQIAAIFSAIACLCYSQLTVYLSGWFIIVLYRQAPVGLNNEGPILYAHYRIQCHSSITKCIFNVTILRFQSCYAS